MMPLDLIRRKFVMGKETDSRPEVPPTGREAVSHHKPNPE